MTSTAKRCGSVGLAVVAAWAIAGCEMPSTLSPSVEIATNLPLLEERVEIGEEIDSSAADIRSTIDDKLQIHLVEEEIDLGGNGSVGSDRFTVDDQAAEVTGATVGLISVDDVPPETTPAVTIASVAPGLVGQFPAGSTIPFLPGTSLPTSVETVTFETIDSVTFSDAESPTLNRVVVSFANNTPLTMGPVSVYLSNNPDTTSGGDVIDPYAQVVLDAVPSGQSQEAPPIILSGVTVASPTYVFTKAAFQSGTNVSADDLAAGSFATTVDISALEVVSAVAQIPKQTFAETRNVRFSNDRLDLIQVDLATSAAQDTNVFELTLRNDILTPIKVTYNLPDFTIPKDSLSFGAGEERKVLFDLNGVTLANGDAPGEPVDNIEIALDVEIVGTGDSRVRIESTDSVNVVADVSALAIERVVGRVPPDKPIEIDISQFDIGIEQNTPAGVNAIHAVSFASSLTIATFSTVADANVDLVMEVAAAPGGGSGAEYNRVLRNRITDGSVIEFRTTEDSLGTDGVTSPLDVINAALDNVFETGAATIAVRGTVTIRGDVELVRNQSRIEARDMVVDTPLQFDVPALTFDAKSETADAFSISVGDGVRDDIIPKARSAALVAHVENHFPLGGALVMFVSPDPRLTRLRSEFPADDQDAVTAIPKALPAGIDITDVDNFVAQDGVYKLIEIVLPEPQRLADGSIDNDNPGISTIVISLGEAELQLFTSPNLYLLPRIQLLQAPGVVQLRADDHLNVSLWMQLNAETKSGEGS